MTEAAQVEGPAARSAPAPLTTVQLLLAWDAQRDRSLQTELGMSELGDCRRRAGYRLAGVTPSNPGGSVQAVLGTLVHDKVADILRNRQTAGQVPAGDLIEHEVSYAGVLGHFDRYHSDTATLRDTKTTSARWLDRVMVDGPSRSNLWQINMYAAGLIASGYPVRALVLDYVARDTGEDYQWTGQFDIDHVRDALSWLDGVRAVDLEYLPRDHHPTSTWCSNCPFRDLCWEGAIPGRDPMSVLYVDDPNAATWAARLADARARKKAAERDEAEARGALDAIRPNDYGTQTVTIPGFDRALRFSVTYPNRLDQDQVRADYAAAGRTAPMKQSGKPQVKLEFVAPETIQEGQP